MWRGGDGGSPVLNDVLLGIARNVLISLKIICLTPTHVVGVGVEYQKEFVLGIAQTVQICKEQFTCGSGSVRVKYKKFCCKELHKMCRSAKKNHVSEMQTFGVGMEVVGARYQILFVTNCIECADLPRKIMFMIMIPTGWGRR